MAQSTEELRLQEIIIAKMAPKLKMKVRAIYPAIMLKITEIPDRKSTIRHLLFSDLRKKIIIQEG